MKNINRLSSALMLSILLSLTACSEMRSLITNNGNSEITSDPTVVPNVMEVNSEYCNWRYCAYRNAR